MDTDELSKKTYKGILAGADKFTPDLTIKALIDLKSNHRGLLGSSGGLFTIVFCPKCLIFMGQKVS